MVRHLMTWSWGLALALGLVAEVGAQAPAPPVQVDILLEAGGVSEVRVTFEGAGSLPDAAFASLADGSVLGLTVEPETPVRIVGNLQRELAGRGVERVSMLASGAGEASLRLGADGRLVVTVEGAGFSALEEPTPLLSAALVEGAVTVDVRGDVSAGTVWRASEILRDLGVRAVTVRQSQ